MKTPLIKGIIKNFTSFFALYILIILTNCCSRTSAINDIIPKNSTFFIRGADLSDFPKIEQANVPFYNKDYQVQPLLNILKDSGINTVRIKLWHTPSNNDTSFDEVKSFSKRLHNLGFKIWITVHYSDTWADPSKQFTPLKWQNLSVKALGDSVYNYTKKIVFYMNPDYIQIGNEINNGFLWPSGNYPNKNSQFKTLLSKGVQAVRDTNKDTKIIIHYAGFTQAIDFFTNIANIDFDIIGLSYYPNWHGKDLTKLKNALTSINLQFKKPIVIAETAYPFTLTWNDQTNNIIGSNNQIIFSTYPATPQGQFDFLSAIKTIINQTNQGIGFCYWGGELVAYKGTNASNGSSWENQALFDFNQTALPVLGVFKE